MMWKAAKILDASPQTLEIGVIWGRGPEYFKKRRMVRYSLKSLIGFMESGRIAEGGGGGHER